MKNNESAETSQRLLIIVCRVFDNDINVAVHASHAAYNSMMFKDALKTGTYDLQNARDAYRVACGPLGMHKDLVYRYIKVGLLECTKTWSIVTSK